MSNTDFRSSRVSRFATRLLDELGLVSLWQTPLDSKLLCAQRFVRLFAYGGSTLILVSYLSALDIADDRIGLFMTLTLAGDVVISFLLTLFADAMGRKAVLALGSILMCASGVIFAVFSNYWILLAAAVFGVISPRCVLTSYETNLNLYSRLPNSLNSGNEIGPFRAVEESTIAHLTPHEVLSDVFAWYSLIGTAGTALGMMVCGWIINLLRVTKGWDFIPACRVIFFVYAAVGAIKLLFTLGLSSKVEAVSKQQKQKKQQSRETEPLLPANGHGEEEEEEEEQESAPKPTHRKFLFLPALEVELMGLVLNLCLLFALDSFASGLASL
jgi:MFS family permease